MEVLKKRGALTHFQILSEISKQDPHLKQKDLAERLGITIQAVSENIKVLTELGYITSKEGRAPYKITQKGILKVKRDALTLKKYSDSVLETMNYYKSIWPAIAVEDLKEGDEVGLFMENGLLYATLNTNQSATAEVVDIAKKGFDVQLSNLKGTIDIKESSVIIVTLPPIKNGGSKNVNMKEIKEIYTTKYKDYGMDKIDKVAVIGTISHAVVNNLNIPIDIEFAVTDSILAANRKGLNVLLFVVGDMSKNIRKRLEENNIKTTIISTIK